PLLLLYVSLLGLRLTPLFVWVILALSLAAIVGFSFSRSKVQSPKSKVGTGGPWTLDFGLWTTEGVTLGGMTLLALGFRLGDIQGLPVPMFGDSLHHTIITTIIETTGRVPAGYQPFVPVDTFTYHFGFHTLAAVLAMLTGDTPTNAVLVMGQALNAAS